jgi:CHAD domain-containing protein
MTNVSAINPKLSVETTFDHLLRGDLVSVNKWVPVALAGKDVEGVHQMRVGLRRMRSTLTLFRLAFPRRITGSIAQEMRWLALQLDRARELDVYIEQNLSAKAGKRKKGYRLMRKIATAQRQKAYDHVRTVIKGKRFKTFNKHLSHWLDSKGWRKDMSGKERRVLKGKVKPFTAKVLECHRNRVLQNGEDIRKLDSEALHRLRIECKKLRYATEFFAPLYGKKMDIFAGRLRRLQDVLGLLHDCTVMKGLQRDLLKSKKAQKLKAVARKLEDKSMQASQDLSKVLVRSWVDFSKTKQPWSL